MMVGLQGAGKTTTTAKLAGKVKQKGKKPLLVACDIYRPAAVDQLVQIAKQINVQLSISSIASFISSSVTELLFSTVSFICTAPLPINSYRIPASRIIVYPQLQIILL